MLYGGSTYGSSALGGLIGADLAPPPPPPPDAPILAWVYKGHVCYVPPAEVKVLSSHCASVRVLQPKKPSWVKV